MSGFYKMDPAAWDYGTHALSLEEEAAYLRIVNAIHIHHGPVPNSDRVLAGMFRCSTRKARQLVGALARAEKVTIEDGHIWNDRARADLAHRGFVSSSRAESGAKGGRTRAEKAAKALADNKLPQANASSREEKRRDTLEPDGSNAPGPVEVTPPDPVKVMFEAGLRMLGQSGMRPERARSLLGKWRKDHGAEAVIIALGRAQREGAINPVEFVEGVLRRAAKGGSRAAPTIGERKRIADGRTLEWAGSIDQWVEVRG